MDAHDSNSTPVIDNFTETTDGITTGIADSPAREWPTASPYPYTPGAEDA